MFNQLPQVTKNILLLNIAFFVATLILNKQGIDLELSLGGHYINSPFFRPYQVVTHFFMHSSTNFLHIVMNMWLFVMLGSFLEKLWGPKRFFIFYIACALGSFALYNVIGVLEIQSLRANLAPKFNLEQFDYFLANSVSFNANAAQQINDYLFSHHIELSDALQTYIFKCYTPVVGASGAVFGILAAFAILFPNTEFRLYFAIPVKAKYLVTGYVLLEMYLSFASNVNDNIAHLAHVGGAIVGAILVVVWRKNDRVNFY
ncbi:MAG: hypothetical protein RLZZ301_1080 [Bacteroidota bacterium]|jgi:membrane associated rhomboid family serine protease